MALYRQHFIAMAKLVHRRGLELKRQGLMSQAFAKFVERDQLMERARS